GADRKPVPAAAPIAVALTAPPRNCRRENARCVRCSWPNCMAPSVGGDSRLPKSPLLESKAGLEPSSPEKCPTHPSAATFANRMTEPVRSAEREKYMTRYLNLLVGYLD